MSTFTDSDFKISKDLTKGASATGEKWSLTNWEAAEKPLNQFDSNLKKIMIANVRNLFGITDTIVSENIHRALGDEFSIILFDKLVKEKLIKPIEKTVTIQKKDKKQKSEKKADIIKRENSWNIINKEIDSVISSFKIDDDFFMPNIFNSKYIELRGVGFLLCAKYLIHNKKKFFGKKSKLLFVNNIIVAMQKFINSCNNLETQSIVDPTQKTTTSEKFLSQLSFSLEELKKEYEYDGMKVCTDTPQLLIYTDYDNVIPKKTSSLYPHQIQMINEVKDCIKENVPLLISLRTMTGTGKTTSACGIAEIVHCFKKYTDNKDLMCIFCCNIRQVMDQVSQLVYNSGIPFAMAYIDPYTGLKEVNNYNCKKDEDRVVTVCGPEACIELLKKYPNAVLFLDEPTIGLDHKTNVAKMNVKIITECLPKWTILSSATLPEKLPDWVLDSHELKYGKTKFVDIYSNKIHIACEIKTLDGELMIPHSKCTETEELQRIINRIKLNPFIGRTYTSNMTDALYKIIQKNNVNVTDIKDVFNDVKNLNADSLRNISMGMLETVSNTGNKTVNNVCSEHIFPRSVDCIEEKSKNDDIVWEGEEKFSVGNSINYDTMCTTSAHRYIRPTLIATIDPNQFVNKHFMNIVDDFTKQFGTVKQINDNYIQKMSIWQKNVDRSEKKMDDSNISSKEERSRNEEELHLSKPELRFTGFQINTAEHIKKYAKNTKNLIQKDALRQEINVTEIMTDPMDVPDSIRILLACGVGIIGHFTGKYNSFVNSLMNDGKLAYIVADSSIAYGTNVPINIVIVTKDFSDEFGINTIYQLISRAGRVGRSWIAEAFIDKSCVEKMITSLHTDDKKFNTELVSLEEIHTEIVENSVEIDDALILEIARKKLQEMELERKEQERIRNEEEARLKKEDQERLQKEEEQKKLEELKKKRSGFSGNRTVQLSQVISNPPAQNVVVTPNVASGFQRSSNGNVGRKVPSTSRFDRLKNMKL